MQKGRPKVLTFLLPRSGALPYAAHLLKGLSGTDNKVYASACATERLPEGVIRIRTYRSMAEAVWRTPFQLFHLWRQVLAGQRAGYRVAYFPVFHYWNLALLWFCRRLGIHTIYTVHNARLHAGEDTAFNRWVQQRCMWLADELICLTEFVRAQAEEMVPPGKRISVIPHGLLQLPGLTPRERRLSGRIRLLFLGRIEPYKGIDLLVQAVSTLPGTLIDQLVIAGKAGGPLRLPETGPATRLIDKRLTEAEMVHWLDWADILVLPYTGATQSGILSLAVSAALPCVCTRVGGLEEQLGPDEAVWAMPEVDDLANAIRILATDADLYRSIHLKLIEKAKEPGWESAARRLKALIRQAHE